MTVERWRQVAMGLMVLAGAVGLILRWHDTPLIVAIVAAAGMLLTGRQRGPLVFISVLLAAGLFWSSLDGYRCSLWWKGRVVYAKLAGDIPYVSWDNVRGAVFSRCYKLQPPAQLEDEVQWLEEKTLGEGKLELYGTALGDFWISAPGENIIKLIVWELLTQSNYESGGVAIQAGDTVIDCGAHIGLFSRFALQRGADRVIAIEPDPENLVCLEENLAQEIAAGKVTVVKAGVWDRKTRLSLQIDQGNSAAHSFVFASRGPNAEKVEGIEVLPLDDIVQDLQLNRVDFIKMDIEGAERQALRGAVDTIARFKPRLAVCSYHMQDDPGTILDIVQRARSDYEVHAKDVDMRWGTVNPTTLFFD